MSARRAASKRIGPQSGRSLIKASDVRQASDPITTNGAPTPAFAVYSLMTKANMIAAAE
jgi:hypothetical protein